MATTRRHWLLNVLIILAVLCSIVAFVVHSRNWTRLQEGRMQILSGIYYRELPFGELDSVLWKERIPQMQRSHGFSFWAREKGIFTDSLYPQRPVYVFVDDLRQHKIKVRYRDTLVLYLNFSDSLETQAMYQFLQNELELRSSQ